MSTTPNGDLEHWSQVKPSCGCGCPAVLRTAEDFRALQKAHPEVFAPDARWDAEPPAEHPDDEVDRLVEEGRGIPMVERLHGTVVEQWRGL